MLNFFYCVLVDCDVALNAAEEMCSIFGDNQNQLQSWVYSIESKLSKAYDEQERLLMELVQHCVETENLQMQIENLRAEVNTGRNLLQSSECKNFELSSQLKTYAIRVDSMEIEMLSCDGLKASNLELKASLEKKSAMISSYEAEINENQSRLFKLESLSQLLLKNITKSLNFHETKFTMTADQNIKDDQNAAVHPWQKYALDKNEYERNCSCTCACHERLNSKERCLVVTEAHGIDASLSVEWESLLHQLTEEKCQQMAIIQNLEERIADLEAVKALLDAQLAEKSQLQRDVQEQLMKATVDKKQMRKSLLQIAALERQLDEKSAQMTLCISRETELQSELENFRLLEKQMEDKLGMMSNESEAMKQLSKMQCQELESRLQKAENQNEVLTNRLRQAENQSSSMHRSINEMNSLLKNLRQESEKSSKQLLDQEAQSEKKLNEMKITVQALKKDLASTTAKLESTKHQYYSDCGEAAKQVLALEEEIRRLTKAEDAKGNLVGILEKQLEEKQELLFKCSNKVVELENLQKVMEKEKAEKEQVHCHDNANMKSFLESCEQKLNVAREDIRHRELQLGELTQTVQNLQIEKKKIITELGKELKETLKQLKMEKREKERQSSSILSLHSEIKRISDLLQQKEDGIEELRQQLRNADVDGKSQALQEALMECEQLKLEIKGRDVRLAESESSLNIREADLKKCIQQFEMKTDELKRREEELLGQQHEIDQLKHELEKQERDLEQSEAIVAHLDVAMKEQMAEFERRVIHLEDLLKQFQFKSSQLQEQASTQSTQTKTLKSALSEKSFLVHELELVIRQMNCDLEAEKEQVLTQTRVIEGLQHEKRNLELIARKIEEQLERSCEKVEHLQEELDHNAQKLTTTEAEFDRSTTALSLAQNSFQVQKSEMENLLLALAKSNEDQLTLTEQLRQSKKKCTLIEEQLSSKLLDMRNSNATRTSVLEEEVSVLQQKLKTADDKQQQLAEQLKGSKQEVNGLQMQLDATQMIANAMKETSIVKDAEIIRLKARLSGHLNAMMMAEGTLSDLNPAMSLCGISAESKSSGDLSDSCERTSLKIESDDVSPNHMVDFTAFVDSEKADSYKLHLASANGQSIQNRRLPMTKSRPNSNNSSNAGITAAARQPALSAVENSVFMVEFKSCSENEKTKFNENSDSALTTWNTHNNELRSISLSENCEKCHRTLSYPVPSSVLMPASDTESNYPEHFGRLQSKSKAVNTLTGTSDPKRNRNVTVHSDKHRFGKVSEEKLQIQNRIKALIGYKEPHPKEKPSSFRGIPSDTHYAGSANDRPTD